MMIPAISHYMTSNPITIERTASLRQAQDLMREHGIRHLPVVDRGELAGIVSQRDLHVLATQEVNLGKTTVADVMVQHPFVVTGDTPLDEVVDIMGEKKYGSVIVMGRSGIEGIFTAVDACQVLSKFLADQQAA